MAVYSWFTQSKWWFSIVFCRFTRGYDSEGKSIVQFHVFSRFFPFMKFHFSLHSALKAVTLSPASHIPWGGSWIPYDFQKSLRWRFSKIKPRFFENDSDLGVHPWLRKAPDKNLRIQVLTQSSASRSDLDHASPSGLGTKLFFKNRI